MFNSDIIGIKWYKSPMIGRSHACCGNVSHNLAVVARGPWVPFTTLEFEFLKKGKRTKTQRENSSCSYNFKCSQVVFKS